MKINIKTTIFLILVLSLNLSCATTYIITPDLINKHQAFLYVNAVLAGFNLFTLIYTALKIK